MEKGVGCQEEGTLGAYYSGTAITTNGGLTCQAWSVQEPHEHSRSYLGDHNYCRNPDGDPVGVWCYTTDPDTNWDHCPVPRCKVPLDKKYVGCQNEDTKGADYIGTADTTIGGFTCQAWHTVFS